MWLWVLLTLYATAFGGMLWEEWGKKEWGKQQMEKRKELVVSVAASSLPFKKERRQLETGTISAISFALRVDQLFDARVKELREADTNWEALDWTEAELEPQFSYRWEGDTLVKIDPPAPRPMVTREAMKKAHIDAAQDRVRRKREQAVLQALSSKKWRSLDEVLMLVPVPWHSPTLALDALMRLRDEGKVVGSNVGMKDEKWMRTREAL